MREGKHAATMGCSVFKLKGSSQNSAPACLLASSTSCLQSAKGYLIRREAPFYAALHVPWLACPIFPPPPPCPVAMFDRGTRGRFLRTLSPQNSTAEPGGGSCA